LLAQLEELFCAAVIEEKVEKKVSKEAILLDPKRWQNLCMCFSLSMKFFYWISVLQERIRMNKDAISFINL
jgi:hypothetical protein